MNEQYGSSMVDYKLYHQNLLRSDNYIHHYQKTHYDFDVVKPKMTLKKAMQYTPNKGKDHVEK